MVFSDIICQWQILCTPLFYVVVWQSIYDPDQTREKDGDREFILLPPHSAVLPRSDVGSDVVEPAPCFLIPTDWTADAIS